MPLNPAAGVTVKTSEPETAGVQRKKKQMGGVTDTLDERAVRENVVFAVTLKLSIDRRLGRVVGVAWLIGLNGARFQHSAV